MIRQSHIPVFKGAVLLFGALLAFPSYAHSQDFPFVGEITQDQVNVRAGQSENFERLGRVALGERVVVLAKEYSWYKIKLPVQCESYVNMKFITMIDQGLGKVSGEHVNIRARADIASAVIGQVNKGDLIRVVETQKDWHKIEPPDSVNGWLLTKFVKFQSKDIPEARKVELPSKNIYRKKKTAPDENSPAKETEHIEIFSAQGLLVDSGEKSPAQDICHRLVVDEHTGYYLQGYRWILDGFLDQKVRIQGTIQPQIKAPYPVVLVTKIELVL